MAVQISGNDITVPRDGTFSRNVSIAGTLTYEDVTNVDSIGLVTARNGIEVGASPGVAASISVDGNAIFSGITTIGGNVKVGTGVTLSPDGDGFYTGVVTATSFVGDGSGLTGAGPTLANGADNRVVTATGANALNAESSFTFDGTTVQVPDAINLNTSGSLIKSNQLRFQSGGAAYIDQYDTSQTVNIRVSSSSSLDTTAMTINHNGHITMPGRPMFTGRPNISNAFRSATETMQLTSHVNVGGHWSNSNYNFTCPVTGYYFMQCNFISNVETYLYMRKDTGSGFTKIYTSSHGYGRGDSSEYRTIAGNHIESCNAGDKLEFYVQGGYYGLEHGSGTIFLLA